MLSLFAVMAGQTHGGINWNTFYFLKYINSHDSFLLANVPRTSMKSTFLRLTPVQKNILRVFLYLADNYYET